MQNSPNASIEIQQIARDKLKTLIKKYSLSNGEDKNTLQELLDYVGKTPLFLAFAKGVSEGNTQLITLTTADTVFVPLFTSIKDCGKLAEDCDITLMKAVDYLPMILEKNRHAVINPFGDYFLLWPELMREHILPYIQEYEKFVSENFANGPIC